MQTSSAEYVCKRVPYGWIDMVADDLGRARDVFLIVACSNWREWLS